MGLTKGYIKVSSQLVITEVTIRTMKYRDFTINKRMLDDLLIMGQVSDTLEFSDGRVEHVRIVIDERADGIEAYYENRE